MTKTKYRFTYDEVRVIVLALVELKNQLIEEGRYTDAVDELLVNCCYTYTCFSRQ
ncbi:MAG: hypothetical protein K6B42_09410 [Clostridia bacterium]|nr:hypothetical protein [Clostridia bacterium]